jgi:crotonobetainyl-CoA:carnitine CoA-transferase CaiB-like acyl-CoA transferase
MTSRSLPLAGIRVVEMTHMVMGPTCGMVLGDLGADVVKVEPIGGDNTRNLLGAGAGFFGYFNRNKKSLAVDLTKPAGKEIVLKLCDGADVFAENFKPGAMDRLGLGQKALEARNPRLIYVACKGFLPGPYEHRTALDEVVQMMGGLAYMTGPVGQPLRAGSSVNDIMGGMFAAIGALAALYRRDGLGGGEGRGAKVEAALFENNVMLVAQHMAQYAVTGQPPAPMPNRISAWAIYDVFEVKNGEQIFLAVVSDAQWATFTEAFGFGDLAADASLKTNNQRVEARPALLADLRQRLAQFSAVELAATFEAKGLPYAPITRPEALFDDPHLTETGALSPMTIPGDGNISGKAIETRLPVLPLTIDGDRLPFRSDPPAIGVDAPEILRGLGYSDSDIDALAAEKIVRVKRA